LAAPLIICSKICFIFKIDLILCSKLCKFGVVSKLKHQLKVPYNIINQYFMYKFHFLPYKKLNYIPRSLTTLCMEIQTI